MNDINNKLKTSQANLNAVTNSFAKNERNVETLRAEKTHLGKAVELNSQKLSELNARLEDAEAAGAGAADEINGLQRVIAEAEAEQARLERALSDTTEELRLQESAWVQKGKKMQEAGRKMQDTGKRMQDIGRNLSRKVTAPLMAVAAASVALGADFESSMGNVAARTQMTAEEVDGLGRSFREMAVSGEYGAFSAREIAAAYSNVAVAGHDVEHATELMSKSMLFATATNTDLKSSTNLLNLVLEKTGSDVSALGRYVNVFAAVTSESGMSVSNLQKAIVALAPTMNTTGASLESMTGKLNLLYRGGIYGLNAARGIEQISNALIAGGDAMDRLGVSAFDSENNLRPINDVLIDLMYALDDVEDAQSRYNLQNQLFTTVYGRAVFNELKNNREAWMDSIDVMYEASSAMDGTGRAFEMAAIQQDSMVNATRQFRVTLEELGLQIAEHIMPHAQHLMERLTALVSRFANLDERTQRNIIRFAALAAAVGPVLKIFGPFVKVLGRVTGAIGDISKAIGKAGSVKAALALKFPKLTKAASFFGKKYTALTAKIAAGNIKLAAANKALKAKAAGLTGVKKVAVLAKAVFAKLFAVMLANPIVAIVAGVAALTVGIVALVSRIRSASEAYTELYAESSAWLNRQKELTEASAQAAYQFEASTREMQVSQARTRQMADTVAYLSSQQELSAAQTATLQDYIKRLNENVDGLTLSYDEQTGALNMSVDALNAYIATAEKAAAIAIKRDETNRIAEEQIRLATELYDTERKRLDLEAQLNDGTSRNSRERRYLNDAIANTIEAEERLRDAMHANYEMQDALAYATAAYEERLHDMRNAQEAAANAIDNTSDKMQAQTHTAEQWEAAQSEALTKIERAFERYHRVATDAFNTVTQTAAISASQMAANLRDNTNTIEQWSRDIARLAEMGLDEGLIEQLRQAGPASAAQVAYLVKMTDEELQTLNEYFARAAEVSIEAMQRGLDPTGVAESAQGLIDHVAYAILGNEGMENALITQLNTAFDALDDNISTIGFDNLGQNTVQDYINGLESMSSTLRDTSRSLGDDTSQGFIEGINRNMAQARAASVAMVNATLNAMRDAAEIRSPSRKARLIGAQIMAGKINGIDSKKDALRSKAADITKTMLKGLTINPAQLKDTTQHLDAWGRSVKDIAKTAAAAISEITAMSLEDAKAHIEAFRYRNDYMATTEVALWEYLLRRYENNAEARLIIDENLASAQAAARAASFEHSREWIERQLELGQMTAKQEIEAWERVVNRHVEGTAERIQAEETLAQRRDQLNQDQKAALAEMERLEQAYIQAVEARTQSLLRTFDMFREVNLMETNVDRARQAMERATKAYNEARQELERAYKALQDAEHGTEGYIRAQEQLIQANGRVSTAHNDLTKATQRAADSQATIMADNLEGQIQNMQEWEREMNKLAKRGIYDGLLEHFRQMGPASLRYLQQLNQSSQSELNRLSQLYQQTHAEARRLATNELRGLRKDTSREITNILSDLAVQMSSQSNPIGRNMIQGIIEGANNKSPALQSTLQHIADLALQAAKAQLRSNSPSRAFMEVGESIGDGLIIGIKSKTREIVKLCKRVADTIKDSFDFSSSSFGFNPMRAHLSTAAAAHQGQAGNVYNINFGGTYHIREEADIDKLAKDVIKKLTNELNHKNRITA